jgi:hypothetical protein
VEHPESSPQESTRRATVNGWLAVAAALAAIWFLDSIYTKAVHADLFVLAIGVFVGIPVLIYVAHRKWTERSYVGAWLVALCVVVLVMTGRAYADASDRRHFNCWEVLGREDTWACAPGSEPRQDPGSYDRFTDTESPSFLCDPLSDSSSTGATLWRCEEGGP